MSRFLSDLDVRLIDEFADIHQLLAPLVYQSDLLGATVVVPAGFQTDFASVPRLPLAYMVVGGKGRRAAVVHDWCYSNPGRYSRKVADDLFAEALRTSGYSRLVTGLMWSGVRIGGGSHYRAENLPQPAHVSDLMAPGP